MNPPSDDELMLFHYHDGLSPERHSEIEDALFCDENLRSRLRTLVRDLDRVGAALVGPDPNSGFEQRLWARIDAALPAPVPIRSRTAWLSRWTLPVWAPALAATLVLAIGFWIGRETAPRPVPPTTALLADDASERLLADRLARHLANTERLLRVAVNGGTTRDAGLAEPVIASNRLYAAAADRAGKPQLAAFLREIEPLLIELANDDGASLGATHARDRIRERDLLFKLRALEAIHSPAATTTRS